ncbi:MAG TPA: hypothetical protein VFG69_15570 [Nannocystaceae bacterium]|nr:hypothetical protein [Nannocystaceae bacterium]
MPYGFTLVSCVATATLVMLAGPPPEPDDTCEVQVEGLPVPARSHHRLELSGGYVRLADDGTRVKVGVQPITVRLVGPRYTGEVQMAARDCTGGHVVVLRARPLPAVLVLVSSPRELVVQCLTCAGDLGRRPWLADEFPPIPVGDGETHRVELRAPGFRVLRRKVWLLPGVNRIEVALTPVRS